ncbi:Vacuolar protein sorting-associated protein 9A, partial [Geodia barretti]
MQMDEYYRNNAEFLDRMRHITCFDHVQRVKGFVAEFLSTPQNPEDASSTVRDFVEEMAGMLSDHQLWREDGEDGYAQVSESLEKFLLQRLYNKVFTPLDSTDAEDDNQLYLSTRRLQFITPDHLDIPSRPLNKVAFHLAAEELAKLDSSKFSSPWEKLVCILNSISILSNLLKHYGADEGTGADELLPYIIYTLILLSPKHMYSNLRYVQRFRSESKLRSEAAYYYTQMESAVLFISNADHKSFTISPDDFARGMREGRRSL